MNHSGIFKGRVNDWLIINYVAGRLLPVASSETGNRQLITVTLSFLKS